MPHSHRRPTRLDQNYFAASDRMVCCVLFFSRPRDPRLGHTMDVFSLFISVLCHFDWLFHCESCPRLDVVHPGRAWSSSPACTWHCSLQLRNFIMMWPQYASFLALTVSNSSPFTPDLLRTHSFVFFAVHETRRIFLSPFISKASRRVSSFFRRVQLSQPYVDTGHTSGWCELGVSAVTSK